MRSKRQPLCCWPQAPRPPPEALNAVSPGGFHHHSWGRVPAYTLASPQGLAAQTPSDPGSMPTSHTVPHPLECRLCSSPRGPACHEDRWLCWQNGEANLE